MVSQQCSCSLPGSLQGSTHPCVALLFHWKPFYQQFVDHVWSEVQDENRGENETERSLVSRGFGGGSVEEGRVEGLERGRGRGWQDWKMETTRSRRGLTEVQRWVVDEGCLSTTDNEEHNWSNQQRGKVERGRGEGFVGGWEGWRGGEGRSGEEGSWQQRQGELCWERASKRALGWERRRQLERRETFDDWERRERRRRREGRWPAFLSREKAQLAAEFRRLGIGACLAGTRGRQESTLNLKNL